MPSYCSVCPAVPAAGMGSVAASVVEAVAVEGVVRGQIGTILLGLQRLGWSESRCSEELRL